MGKDPAFLFYPNDWLGGTMGMTFEEKGAYMELLMLQFNRGHMTSHMIGQTIGQLFGQIIDKFEVDEDGLYYNARLEDEIKKRQSYVASRNNNRSGVNQYNKAGGHAGGHMTSHMSGHTTGHMENENENVNVVKTKSVNKKGTAKKQDKTPFGELNNVLLTDGEYEKLVELLGKVVADKMIDDVGYYKAKSGKTYASDYAAVRSWHRNDLAKQTQSVQQTFQPFKPKIVHDEIEFVDVTKSKLGSL